MPNAAPPGVIAPPPPAEQSDPRQQPPSLAANLRQLLIGCATSCAAPLPVCGCADDEGGAEAPDLPVGGAAVAGAVGSSPRLPPVAYRPDGPSPKWRLPTDAERGRTATGGTVAGGAGSRSPVPPSPRGVADCALAEAGAPAGGGATGGGGKGVAAARGGRPGPGGPPPDGDLGRDFDLNPTVLYALVHGGRWGEAAARAAERPLEARTWVYRRKEEEEKEGGGGGRSLRWRMLPLHAAALFGAPESVVQALLDSHPLGARVGDDRGMLPLHLAFRAGAGGGVVNALLAEHPGAVRVRDGRGRVPLDLAQASSGPGGEAFDRAMERGQAYFAFAYTAVEKAAVMIQYEQKMAELKKEHEKQMECARDAWNTEKLMLEVKIDVLEGVWDLMKEDD